LEVTVEKVGACTAKVHVKVAPEEFDGAVERAFKNAGRNVRMKGFRTGHVPRKVLERSFGEQIRNEAVEHFLQQAYQKAIQDEGLKIVGFERVDLGKLDLSQGKGLEHAFEVSLRPEIELGTYRGLGVESELEPVLEPELEAALEDFRQQQSTVEPAGEEGLAEDGMLLAKARWLSGEEAVMEREGLRLSPRLAPPGSDEAAWKAALLGLKAGERAEVAITFPSDFQREALRGQPGTLEVTAGEVFRIVPPTDQELLKALGAEEGADLRAAVRERLQEAKREQEERRIEGALIEKLLAAHPIEVPARMVEEQAKLRGQAYRRELASGGIPEAELDGHVEQRKEELERAAERGIRTLFLMQAIAEKEKLLVGNEDMQAELAQIAERNQATLEEVTKYYREQGLFDQMALEILERKVRRFLREAAEIVQPK
jgi:trigger factor